MKKIAIAFAAVSTFVLLAACGDGTVEACKGYVESYNGLECVGDGRLADNYCESEDSSVCERADYWDCLKEGTTCGDDGTISTDTADCDPSCA